MLTVISFLTSCKKDDKIDEVVPVQKTQQQLLAGRWNLVNASIQQFIPANNPVPFYTDFKTGQSGDYAIFSGNKAFIYDHGNNVADTFDIAYTNTNMLVYDNDLLYRLTFTDNNTKLRLASDTITFGNRETIITNLKR